MSNLPWFMDLTFRVPVQYCSLQHQMYFHHQEYPQPNIISILAQPLLSFWSIIGHLLTWGAHLLVSYVFAFSCCPWGSQGKWSGLPFPSPVDHVLSELSGMTHLSSVALQGMAHSFIELHKAVIHVIILVSFWSLWFSFWSLWDYDSCFFCLPPDGWG